MKSIILALLFLIPNHTGCLKLDIVVLVDMSASVYGKQGTIADALETFINRFELGEDNVKISIVSFSRNTEVLVGLTSSKKDLLWATKLIRVKWANGDTQIGNALYKSGNELLENGRPGVIKLIILISDGGDNGEIDTRLASNQLMQMSSIGICSVMLSTNESDKDLMKDIAMDGMFIESEYEELVETLKKLDVCL